MKEADTIAPALYLVPSLMADVDPQRSLPEYNIRLVSTLRYFVVENVRSARRFLKRCDRSIDIDSLHFVELSEHTPAGEVDAMLDPLVREGHSIGVISEAGCPAVADPGADLVAVAQRKGVRVVPLVGPSSIIMSLMASGFNGQSFAFRGYLPVESQARSAAIRHMQKLIASERQTQIFIETPYRNKRLIDELTRTLPPQMRLCVAVDITGPGETIVTDTMSGWKRRNFDPGKVPAIFLLFD